MVCNIKRKEHKLVIEEKDSPIFWLNFGGQWKDRCPNSHLVFPSSQLRVIWTRWSPWSVPSNFYSLAFCEIFEMTTASEQIKCCHKVIKTSSCCILDRKHCQWFIMDSEDGALERSIQLQNSYLLYTASQECTNLRFCCSFHGSHKDGQSFWYLLTFWFEKLAEGLLLDSGAKLLGFKPWLYHLLAG